VRGAQAPEALLAGIDVEAKPGARSIDVVELS